MFFFWPLVVLSLCSRRRQNSTYSFERIYNMNRLIICRIPAVSKQMSPDDESILIIASHWILVDLQLSIP